MHEKGEDDCRCEVVHLKDLFPEGVPARGYELQGLLEDGFEWDTDTSLKRTCYACRKKAHDTRKEA